MVVEGLGGSGGGEEGGGRGGGGLGRGGGGKGLHSEGEAEEDKKVKFPDLPSFRFTHCRHHHYHPSSSFYVLLDFSSPSSSCRKMHAEWKSLGLNNKDDFYHSIIPKLSHHPKINPGENDDPDQ